jgi:5-methylcytosine-specific restriction endonuclease McrA
MREDEWGVLSDRHIVAAISKCFCTCARRAVVFSYTVASPSTESEPVRLLSSSVLVLNRFYLPVHVITVRRAFILLYRDGAEVIDIEAGHYANYDFAAWCELSAFRALEQKQPHEDWIRAVSFEIQVPRIIRLFSYDRVPRKSLRFNRRNIFARDGHCCQYCGRSMPLSQLNIDHVMPRSRGGKTTWENVVCSCLPCNTRKGGRTPQEAHMRLLTTPAEPKMNPLLAMKLNNPKYQSWRSFVTSAGAAVESA